MVTSSKNALSEMKYISEAGKKHPTTTVLMSRLPICAPVMRFAAGSRSESPIVIKTPSYGSVTLSKQLTQTHRDILDAIFAAHIKIFKHDTGDVTYLFRLSDIMKLCCDYQDQKRIKRLIKDLTEISIQADRNGWTVTSKIVMRYGYSTKAYYDTAGKKLFGNGQLFFVQLSTEFLSAFNSEIRVHYPSLVAGINRIESPLVKAVVRFFLTQQPGVCGGGVYRINKTTLLSNLGIFKKPSAKEMEKLATELTVEQLADVVKLDKLGISREAYGQKLTELTDNADVLAKYNIIDCGDMYEYSDKPAGVWFTKPQAAGETDENEV